MSYVFRKFSPEELTTLQNIHNYQKYRPLTREIDRSYQINEAQYAQPLEYDTRAAAMTSARVLDDIKNATSTTAAAAKLITDAKTAELEADRLFIEKQKADVKKQDEKAVKEREINLQDAFDYLENLDGDEKKNVLDAVETELATFSPQRKSNQPQGFLQTYGDETKSVIDTSEGVEPPEAPDMTEPDISRLIPNLSAYSDSQMDNFKARVLDLIHADSKRILNPSTKFTISHTGSVNSYKIGWGDEKDGLIVPLGVLRAIRDPERRHALNSVEKNAFNEAVNWVNNKRIQKGLGLKIKGGSIDDIMDFDVRKILLESDDDPKPARKSKKSVYDKSNMAEMLRKKVLRDTFGETHNETLIKEVMRLPRGGKMNMRSIVINKNRSDDNYLIEYLKPETIDRNQPMRIGSRWSNHENIGTIKNVPIEYFTYLFGYFNPTNRIMLKRFHDINYKLISVESDYDYTKGKGIIKPKIPSLRHELFELAKSHGYRKPWADSSKDVLLNYLKREYKKHKTIQEQSLEAGNDFDDSQLVHVSHEFEKMLDEGVPVSKINLFISYAHVLNAHEILTNSDLNKAINRVFAK